MHSLIVLSALLVVAVTPFLHAPQRPDLPQFEDRDDEVTAEPAREENET